jgi:hypothetical protein
MSNGTTRPIGTPRQIFTVSRDRHMWSFAAATVTPAARRVDSSVFIPDSRRK